MSWTHSICYDCWHKEHGSEIPAYAREHPPIKCCLCGRWTIEGIFIKRNPDIMKCKHEIDNWRKNAVNPKAKTGKLEKCKCGQRWDNHDPEKCNGSGMKTKECIVDTPTGKKKWSEVNYLNPKPKSLEDVIKRIYGEAEIDYDGLSNEGKYFEDLASAIRTFIKENAPKTMNHADWCNVDLNDQSGCNCGVRNYNAYRKELFEAMGITEGA